jgi:virginiamycin B lyase
VGLKNLVVIQSFRRVYKKFLLLLSTVLLAASASVPVFAAPTFSSNPVSTSYRNPGQITSAGGSLWYIESTTSAPTSYDSIGKMTTSGTTTDYNISYPSGTTGFNIAYLTTGPDGNVWFDGCASSNQLYAGYLNISTGAVTFYLNTQHPSCGGTTAGPMTTGSDGNVWYVVLQSPGNGHSYLSYVNPSTGTTSTGYTLDTFSNLTGLANGPDGRLWVTDAYYNRIVAYPISGGTTGVYNTPDTFPTGIISGPDGNLWFMEWSSTKYITKVTTSGSFTKYAQASSVYPQYIAAGPDGAVWFVDVATGAPKIGRITSSGSVTEYAIPGGSGVNSLGGIALGPDNAMWFSYGYFNGSTTTFNLGRIGY